VRCACWEFPKRSQPVFRSLAGGMAIQGRRGPALADRLAIVLFAVFAERTCVRRSRAGMLAEGSSSRHIWNWWVWRCLSCPVCHRPAANRHLTISDPLGRRRLQGMGTEPIQDCFPSARRSLGLALPATVITASRPVTGESSGAEVPEPGAPAQFCRGHGLRGGLAACSPLGPPLGEMLVSVGRWRISPLMLLILGLRVCAFFGSVQAGTGAGLGGGSPQASTNRPPAWAAPGSACSGASICLC